MSIGKRFAELVWDAADHPRSADKAALFRAADAYLDAADGQNESCGAIIARRLAHAALDYCVFDDIERIREQRDVFIMYGKLSQMKEQIQELTAQ